jgi:hypothetical protein
VNLISFQGIPKICAGVYLFLIVSEWSKTRNVTRFVLEFLPLFVLAAVDVFLASSKAGYVTFGPDGSSPWVILTMFGAILLGIGSRYIFYLREHFSWLDFAKPLCISPILLIPLISSLQSVKSLEPIQVIMFALLAFQNGFFWQAVLQQARPSKKEN